MSNPLKGPKYLSRTINAILQLKREKVYRQVSVRNIRRLYGVDGSNKSAINFYSRALAFLEREGALKAMNHSSPKKYAVIDEKKLLTLKSE